MKILQNLLKTLQNRPKYYKYYKIQKMICYKCYKYYIFKKRFCNTKKPVKSDSSSNYYKYYNKYSMEIY